MTHESLATLENEALVVLTEKLNQIDSPYARLLRTWAKLQCTGDQPTASKIYQTGVAFIHAAVENHSLSLPVEYSPDGKVAIVNPSQVSEDSRKSIDMAVAAYKTSRESAWKMFNGGSIGKKLEQLRVKFIELLYSNEDSQTMMDLLNNPFMVFFKWDHEEVDRPVFGGLLGMPQESHAPLFGYAKMKENPLTILLSENEKNSGPMYAKKLANMSGLSEETIWFYLLRHENVHALVTEPLFKLLLHDSAVTWVGEAIAMLHGDAELFSGKLFSSRTNHDLPTQEVVSASSNTGVNYPASLEVWMSMAAIKSGMNALDWKDIKQSSMNLIMELTDSALEGQNGWSSDQIPINLLGSNAFRQIDLVRPSVRELLRTTVVAS